ncbi:uncharacterized protein LOC129748370 [Uranotaenia lowii]|uniref:uncharacterized protein LOC129748370 n=1 Tax=Uranotaenia lowii TaxID=190385 RepID=UPI002478E58D|nr:uncharacterized protein LOC129748370 [Uranotaenia lowii]
MQLLDDLLSNSIAENNIYEAAKTRVRVFGYWGRTLKIWFQKNRETEAYRDLIEPAQPDQEKVAYSLLERRLIAERNMQQTVMNNIKFEHIGIMNVIHLIRARQPNCMDARVGTLQNHHDDNIALITTYSNSVTENETAENTTDKIIRSLIVGSEIDLKHTIDQEDRNSQSELINFALKFCVQFGYDKPLEYLVGRHPLQFSILNELLSLSASYSHWSVTKMLVKLGANPWADDLRALTLIMAKRNFKIVRQLLKNGIPEDMTHPVLCHVISYGSKKLLEFTMKNIKFDFWKCTGAMEAAMRNPHNGVFKLVQRILFPTPKSGHESTDKWVKLFYELRILMFLNCEDDFFAYALAKHPGIAESILEKLRTFLRIENFQGIRLNFNSGMNIDCSSLSKNLNNGQIKEVIEHCSGFMEKLSNLEPSSLASFSQFSNRFSAMRMSYIMEVEVKLYHDEEVDQIPFIFIDVGLELMSEIEVALKIYFQKIKNLKMAFARVTVYLDKKSNVFKQYEFIFMDSSYCLVESTTELYLSLGFLLNLKGKNIIYDALKSKVNLMLVKKLLYFGANPLMVNQDGRTAFHAPLNRNPSEKLYQVLHQHCVQNNQIYHANGAHIFNLLDNGGCTPLGAAVIDNDYTVVSFMLRNGAYPEIPNDDTLPQEQRPLPCAIISRNHRMAKLLISHCPNLVNLPADQEGNSNLNMAVKENADRIVRILLEAGSTVNHEHVLAAIKNESVESLQVLMDFAISKGLNVLENDFQKSALQEAYESGNQEIVNMIALHWLVLGARRVCWIKNVLEDDGTVWMTDSKIR